MARLRKRNGIYHAAFYDETGKRRWRTTHCSDKRAALAFAGRLERAAQDPDYAASTYTLKEALEALYDDRVAQAQVGKRSMATAEMYKKKAGHWRRMFEVDENGVEVPFPLARMTPEFVDGAIAQRRREGASESTIAKELVTLGSALRLAKRTGRWHGDVDTLMPHRFSPEYVPRERFLARDEFQLLVANLLPDHAARVAFEVATSANWGETTHVLRSDIGGDVVPIRGTKNANRWRSVPVVADWQRELLAFASKHGRGEGDVLFASSYEGFTGALRRACDDLKLAPLSSNDLRRTYAQWMRADGMPAELVAPAMGHATTAMVERIYGRMPADVLAARMAKIFASPVPQQITVSTDKTDSAHSQGARKSLICGAEGGNRTRTDYVQGILSPQNDQPLSPRKAKRNRNYEYAAATPVPQLRAVKGCKA